jgi:hypothetical protein
MNIDDHNKSGRIRRSTLERFNDEMSLLDHPVEPDIDPEFYEPEPPSKRPRIVATLVAALVVGGGGLLFLSRHMGSETPSELAVVPAPATPAAMIPSPMPAPAVEPATPVAPAPVETAPAPAETAPAPEPEVEAAVDAIPSDVPSVATVVVPSAWTKIGARSGKASTRHHRSRR